VSARARKTDALSRLVNRCNATSSHHEIVTVVVFAAILAYRFCVMTLQKGAIKNKGGKDRRHRSGKERGNQQVIGESREARWMLSSRAIQNIKIQRGINPQNWCRLPPGRRHFFRV
jgi:hypothetical protein